MALAACDSPTSAKPSPGIRVLSAAMKTDTILAPEPDLVVEVREVSGRLVAGEPVTFRVSGAGSGYAAVIGSVGTDPYGLVMQTTTDAKGRASVAARLGVKAGPGFIAVTAPALGMTDTVRFTVLPGAADQVEALPWDTAVYVGRSYTPRTAVYDRFGNARTDTVSLTAGTGAVSVASGSVTGQAVGRGFSIAKAGRVSDTVWTSVVPAATLLAFEPRIAYETGGGTQIVQAARIIALGADGSGYRVVVQDQAGVKGEPSQPAWWPGSDALAFVDDGGLKTATLDGRVSLVLAGGDVPVRRDFPVQFSADGRWVYFTRGSSGNQLTSWRVHPDGSGAEQVSPARDWGMEMSPSPDPSGTRVAYATNRATNSTTEFTIRTVDLATGAVQALDIPGSFPRWSPQGDRIAFLDPVGQLRTVAPAGGATWLVGRGVGTLPSYGWSPDGAWLVVSGAVRLHTGYTQPGLSLVNVATGEVLPLVFSHSLRDPAWQR